MVAGFGVNVGAMGAGLVSFSNLASRAGGSLSGFGVSAAVLDAGVAFAGTGFSCSGTGFNSQGTTRIGAGAVTTGDFGVGTNTVGDVGIGDAGRMAGEAVADGVTTFNGRRASAGGIISGRVTLPGAGMTMALTASLFAAVGVGPTITGVVGAGTLGRLGVVAGTGVVGTAGGVTAATAGCGGRRRLR